MKTTAITGKGMTLILGTAMMILSLTACSKDENSTAPVDDSSTKEALLGYTYTDSLPTAGSCLDSIPPSAISPEEEAALVFLREEEYLAHDVYLTLSALYTKPIFRNIAKSELRHTEAVKNLLGRYNIPDPAANHVTGTFSNPDLQALYNTLVTQGSSSLLNGLIVGATIEDLDISDLHENLLVTDNPDIVMVMNNLMRGSRNHLRSFYANITFLGGTYSPQYISQEEFDAIVSTPHEIGAGGC
jgi:hypothetical protein